MADIKELPEGWEIKRLGDVATYLNGKAFKPSDWKDHGKPIIRIQNLNKSSAPFNYSNVIHEDKYKVITGDLLFAWSASLGAYIWKGEEAWLNQHIFKVVPKPTTNKLYLYYLLEKIVIELYTMTHGSGMVHITKGKFENTEVPLPPLQVQQAIVSKIEELFSELDKGIAELKLAQQQLKVYRQSVLKYAFEGRLNNENVKEGELPARWEWKTFENVCLKIGDIDHKMPKKVNNGIYPYLSTKDFSKDYKMSFDNAKYISEEDFKFLSKKIKPEKGDIIFPRYGTIGRNILVDYEGDFLVSYSCAIIKPNKSIIDTKYLYNYSLSPVVSKEVKKYVVETTQANIGIASIKKFILPLPPISEQREVVVELERRLNVADKLAQNIKEALHSSEVLRQSILKKAFSGELLKEVKPVDVPAIKNEYFHQLQLVALVINRSTKKKIDHGEMTLAKNLYLMDAIYKVPTGFKYNRWHLGPYPPAIKKVVTNKEYFRREDNHIEILNEEKLLKYTNPFQDQITHAIDDLASIFSKYNSKERSHKTELLATVCKVIEDIKSTDLAAVRESMKDWKIELKTSRFKNKAEKFDEAETEKCIGFIVERGWDRKLI